MAQYDVYSEPNQDREGVQIWIERDDGEICSLECADNEVDPFMDGTRVPESVIRMAWRLAEKVGY